MCNLICKTYLKNILQDVLQPASDFFAVNEDECINDYFEAINDWSLTDPRNLNCKGREEEVIHSILFSKKTQVYGVNYYYL